jgi:hypothetical protein
MNILSIPNLGESENRHHVLTKVMDKGVPHGLWLEFGVATGKTINLISNYTTKMVYGFDSFEGLPERWRDGFEKGAFNRNGEFPEVNDNVVLIKGLFSDTLAPFLKEQNKKITFMHIDCDLYSSTKTILEETFPYLEKECILVFDELVNYPGFDGETGELKAFYEFVTENKVEYEWIGMNGIVTDGREDRCYDQHVAVIIHSITSLQSLH